jgi:DNA-binding winged helix-turn-helix (wHTH) protein
MIPVRLVFGDCILDTDTREVYCQGRPVHLGPKAYDLLQLLLAARPRVLSKLDLYGKLWPDVAVSESSLSTVVAELREALGDCAKESRYIRTVYGYGYAFSAKAVEVGAIGSLGTILREGYRLVWGTQEIPLDEGEYLIGRARGVPVQIDDPAVSRHHARIIVSRGVATIEDLGSRNGTALQGERLDGIATLADGDRIVIGPVTLVFRGPKANDQETLVSTLDTTVHEPTTIDDNRQSRNVTPRR